MAGPVDGSLSKCRRGGTSIVIRGRGLLEVRVGTRTSFYPCGTLESDTTCSMRARCAGDPRFATRPFFEDGRRVATRGHYGRVDL